jgi:hypothetical protein
MDDDEKTPRKVGQNLVATIVSSYVKHNTVSADALPTVIASVHQALSGLGKTCPACRTPSAGCAGAAIGSARLRGLLGVRVSQPDVTAPSPRPAWSRACGLFRPMAAAARSPDHRAGLFGATFSDGQANRARPRPKNGQRCSPRRAGTCSTQQTAAPIAAASGADDGIEYVLGRRT